LLWLKCRWRCIQIGCPQQTFTESVGQLPARMRTTGRLRVAVAEAVADNRSIAEVAAFHGLGWATVQKAVDTLTEVVLAEPDNRGVVGEQLDHGVGIAASGRPRSSA